MYVRTGPPHASSPEVIARFDELFERRYPSRTTESTALLDRIGASWRAQNRAAASALAAIGELFGYRLARCSDTEDWAVDTEAAVSAEVAAALRMSQGLAASQLRYARAMRERLPKLAEVFKAGDIDQRTFATIVYRTDLITDRDVLATVDGQLALTVVRWPSMTRGRLAGQIDKIVAKADADAVRRRTERRTEREVWFADLEGGLSEIHGSLLSPDAHALDKRLTALAGTVCEHDPRTREQRRADALAALAAGADRLGCRCGLRDCTAGKRPAATPVVIHVIAEQATIDGRSGTTASEVCADGLIVTRTHRRVGRRGQAGAAGPPGRCRARAGICAVEEARRFRAVPGSDVPLARLRSTRHSIATSTTPSPTPTAGPRMPRTSSATAVLITS